MQDDKVIMLKSTVIHSFLLITFSPPKVSPVDGTFLHPKLIMSIISHQELKESRWFLKILFKYSFILQECFKQIWKENVGVVPYDFNTTYSCTAKDTVRTVEEQQPAVN